MCRLVCSTCGGVVGWVFHWAPYCKRCQVLYTPTGPRFQPIGELIRHGTYVKWWRNRGIGAPM